MSRKLIVANWKMNPQTEAEAIQLAKAEDKKNVVLCPPFVYLSNLKLKTKNSKLGAQDVFFQENGAFTGEISPLMLKSLGAKYVIIGHSERRALGETDEIINRKVKAALSAGLKVIFCVGENLAIRRRGMKAVKNFIKQQLSKDLRNIGNWKLKIENLLVAYEPVWAIGTGKADTPKDTKEVVDYIRSYLNWKLKIANWKLLYGGSVNAKNAKGFLEVSDGLLVGGASLQPKEFLKILYEN